MTDLLVTADTNLLASGVVRLRSHPEAAPAQFVRAWRDGQFLLVQSVPLLAEIDRTLAKRYFAQRLRDEDHAGLRQLLERRARLTPLTVAVHGVATQPEDDLVLATALSGGAQFVVTGDYKLVGLKQYQGLILVSVHEFLATLPGLQTEADG
jgi:uncharacterized protein